jgi:prepilin-type N-terminal cleavage/methylation domain-containing protein
MTFSSKSKTENKKGFSLVELVIGTAVFLVIVLAVYNSYVGVFSVVHASRAKIEAISLINERLEIVRNLPYSSVGVVSGIPSGVLVHSQNITRDTYQYTVLTTVRNFDDPFDGTLGGTPNDLSPADSKIVEIEVNCTSCKNFVPMVITTRVSPKNLETASTNGALFVRVFDANGDPVEGANVHIENNQVAPAIVIDDVTNNSGMLQVVDAPPGINAYEITISKPGFSTDKTYIASIDNSNPSKPHATIVLQQVTQVSFVIDELSSLNISSVSNTCNPVGSFDFSLKGNKLIGTSPDVLKYDENKITNGSGQLLLSDIEWDTYSFTGTDLIYDVVGTNPLLPISVTPGSTQNVQLIMASKDPNTLLVIVKDGATNLPLSGVSATLTKVGFSESGVTGQGFLGQTDWSGGGGQATSTNATMYLASDGNLETQDPVGDVLLKKVFSDYVHNGVLTSSSFDTGSASNFQQIDWTPVDQPVDAGDPNVRIQIATNNDGATWDFNGPDGTSGSYYTVANKNIHSSNNGNRFLRYKLFLDSSVTTATPNISDIFFTFTSSCTPPGQTSFSGLSSGIYNLHLEKAGYVSQDVEVNVNSSWVSTEVVLVAS